MTAPTLSLTANEIEAARRAAMKAMQQRLAASKPNRANYEVGASRAAIAVADVLAWSKFSVLIIAVAMGIASAIRNVTAVFQNYTASGTVWGVSVIAAVTFVIGVEVALFVLALAQQGIAAERRATKKQRRVASLADLWRGIKVRIGVAPPLGYDELPERSYLGYVLALAFAFAVVSNLAIGLAPALTNNQQSLQSYLSSIPDKTAKQQLTFILDLALALLPPALTTIGGHLIAQFAADYAQQADAGRAVYEADLADWRATMARPLDTDEGRVVFNKYLQSKLAEKRRRLEKTESRPTMKPEIIPAGADVQIASGNGHSTPGNPM